MAKKSFTDRFEEACGVGRLNSAGSNDQKVKPSNTVALPLNQKGLKKIKTIDSLPDNINDIIDKELKRLH